jgi:hypothetical protein
VHQLITDTYGGFTVLQHIIVGGYKPYTRGYLLPEEKSATQLLQIISEFFS